MFRSRVVLVVALCICSLFAVAASAQTPPFPQETSPPLSVPLLAGKSTRIGTVDVRVEGAELVVQYALNPDWSLNETHLHIASSWTLIPQNKNRHPWLISLDQLQAPDVAVGSRGIRRPLSAGTTWKLDRQSWVHRRPLLLRVGVLN